jgi:hypothetical protein
MRRYIFTRKHSNKYKRLYPLSQLTLQIQSQSMYMSVIPIYVKNALNSFKIHSGKINSSLRHFSYSEE